jgi:hypothetical protein
LTRAAAPENARLKLGAAYRPGGGRQAEAARAMDTLDVSIPIRQ